jgi:hypothetical protein
MHVLRPVSYLRLAACSVFALLTSTLPGWAQAGGHGSLQVTVTTQNGTIQLPGVTVTVVALDGRTVSTQVSDESGLCTVPDLLPGLYSVRATLEGFDPARSSIQVGRESTAKTSVDLRLSGVSERVDVIGNAETAPPTIGESLSTRGVLESRLVEQLPIRDHSVLSALKLLAGIVEGPGGVSIKGGRTNQSGLQIGMATQTDSSTGSPLFRLPVDAIDSVEVLPNPYSVEFGRFSSGLTVIKTKRADDTWRFALNSPDVSFRTVRSQPWNVTGLESFGPRIGFGGPIIKDRLFLEQSAQMRYAVTEVWSRPPDQTKTNLWLSAFTRLDLNMTPNQSLTGNINIFPSKSNDVTLNTFNGPDVAADQNDNLLSGSVTAHTTLSAKALLESTVQLTGFHVDVSGHGDAPMVLMPSQNSGNFFNRQQRTTDSVQWVEAITGSREWGGVTHLFKAGLDLMHTTFTGTSSSSPVIIRRDDGTLARELTFAGPIEQNVDTTDFAVFGQDRMQPVPRLLLEFGARVDRDGVLAKTNATPRFGTVILLDEKGAGVLRGGVGLFYERTPSVVGAFDQFETTTDIRYADAGVTPLGPPQIFTHLVAPTMNVARSATWNLEYDQRMINGWSMRAGVLQRRGSHELIVNPVALSPGDSRAGLVLSSEGISRYSEGEVTLRYAPGPRFDVSGTYVRSSAMANLNAYTAFFDNVRYPVISYDAYAPMSSDVPNRLIAHTRTIFGSRWLVSSIFEVHNGFPYSVTNDKLDWVGPRNQIYHFPTLVLLDLDLEHKFTFLKWKPWIGVRAFNALNRFTPTEVQSNLSSPAFGSFYNSYGRQIRFQLRIE